MGLGTTEILIIAVVVMVLFGAGALPKFAKNLGKAKNEFEKGLKESPSTDDDSDEEIKINVKKSKKDISKKDTN
jgi:sec-independent protein translocase protein TatA